MIEGVDYSDSRPSPTGLVEVGKVFAGRYVGAGSGPKLLQRDEAITLSDAGLMIVSLVEGAAAGAMGGFAAGVQHATQARQWHIDRGFPWPVPCYFAVDFDVSATQWPTVSQYLQGAASVIGLSHVGIYGGLNAMKWAQRDHVASWFFQTYAWSAGVWDGGLEIEQYRNDVSLVGGTVDLCRAPTPEYGGWSMTTPDPLQAQVDDNGWALNALTHLHPLTQGGRWKGVPVEVVPLLTDMAADVTEIKSGLSTPIVPPTPGPSTMDMQPVLDAITNLGAKVDAIEATTTVDAVAIGKSMTADPAFVAALSAAVAAQLANITGSITLSGSLSGGIRPPVA